MTDERSGLSRWTSSHLVLVGEMATGKTTVGRLLADLVGRPHLDSDEMLEERIGMSGARFASLHGVGALHEMELRVFMDSISEAEEAVISPAASILDSEEARGALVRNIVVWIDAPVEVALERIKRGDHRRDVGASEIEHLRERRLRHYRNVADLHVDSETVSPEELATEIAGSLPGFRSRPEA